MEQKSSWYKSWFNTPYYHILYKNRDYSEAQNFLNNLMDYLKLSNDEEILDLACGKGRHSIFLNELGYKVTGVDLAEESIRLASIKSNDRLKFFVHDMLEPLEHQYDCVLNLFTSFGYFENDKKHQQVIQHMSGGLKKSGFLVIDFLNAHKVINEMVHSEKKVVDGLEFQLTRSLTDGYITKDISFVDNSIEHHYQEKVRAFNLNDFENFFGNSGLMVKEVFGDYDLNKYDKSTSSRLIIVGQKL